VNSFGFKKGRKQGKKKRDGGVGSTRGEPDDLGSTETKVRRRGISYGVLSKEGRETSE